MKEQILKLRSKGKTYREIQNILKCSRSLISYYVNPNGKINNTKRKNKNRFRQRMKYKLLLGGKCCICGYSKCLNALHFHHKDMKQKSFHISDAIWGKHNLKEQQIKAEIKKCILLCANCHAELHSKNDFYNSKLGVTQTSLRGSITNDVLADLGTAPSISTL
jgi:hypothetical protein